MHCTGGCTGSYSEPCCTTEYEPPMCEVDAECHASCSARAAANAECDPTHVEIVADVQGGPIWLSTLGVHEGDMGLFDVARTSISAKQPREREGYKIYRLRSAFLARSPMCLCT